MGWSVRSPIGLAPPGVGHELWCDQEAGFSAEDQDALMNCLITLKPPEEFPLIAAASGERPGF